MMVESRDDRPSMAVPLALSLTFALACSVVAILINPLIGIALIVLWLPSLIYGLIRFGLRGAWFPLGVPVALSAPGIFFNDALQRPSESVRRLDVSFRTILVSVRPSS
jgi:hypothetical protein